MIDADKKRKAEEAGLDGGENDASEAMEVHLSTLILTGILIVRVSSYSHYGIIRLKERNVRHLDT